MDEIAMERLFRQEYRRLFNVLLRRVWNQAIADELTQESFLRLWQIRSTIRMETVTPLLFRIGLNLARRHRYREGLRAALPWHAGRDLHGEEPSSPVDQRFTAESKSLANVAIEALPGRYREVILMTELAGMDYRDVAVALRIREGTVASRRHRALDKLSRILREKGYELDQR